MADPVTLLTIGAITSAATTAAGAVGTYMQGKGEADNLKTMARQTELETGAAEEVQRRQATRQLGAMQAAQGQSGVVGGSTADVYRQSAIDAELDALNIRYQGMSKSNALKTQAKATKKAATASAILGLASAGGQLAAGMGQAGAYKAKTTPRDTYRPGL